MRFSRKLIQELQDLLKKQCGVEYSDEEAQIAGIAIVRFSIAKHQRSIEELNKGNVYGKLSSSKLTSKS